MSLLVKFVFVYTLMINLNICVCTWLLSYFKNSFLKIIWLLLLTLMTLFDFFFQYAHKLAYLIGQNVGQVPNEKLTNTLFFL